MGILSDAREIAPQLTELRRRIHARPELGTQEHETALLIEEQLDAMGIEHRRSASTGVAALIRGAREGACVGLRADIDALPIQDEKTGEVRSLVPGVMHACGHDAHAACLLGAARLLAARASELAGCVRLVFQPNEEGDGGALPMIEDGVMDEPRVSAFFGLHVDPSCPVGSIRLMSGTTHAASDVFDAEITGPGGHGAHPEATVDVLYAACKCVDALQSVVSRSISPLDGAVVTVGSLHAGTVRNVIPSSATLSGTMRTLSARARETARRRVREIMEGVCATFGAELRYETVPSYPVLVNDERMTELVRSCASDMLGPDAVLPAVPSLGVEDFAYFAERVPSCFFDLGVRNEARGIVNSIHTPLFDIDEDALPIGAALLASAAMTFLAEGA